MIKMTEQAAKLLAKKFDYRARKLCGQWVVWSDDSDHVVEFDAKLIEQANNS